MLTLENLPTLDLRILVNPKKPNHGLVLMWQSLAENFAQPLAVFASHGPVKGIIY